MKIKKSILIISSVVCVCIASIVFITLKYRGSVSSSVSQTNKILQVHGAQIIDAQGNPVILKGAMIDSSFAYSKQYATKDPTQILNTTTFNAMRSWNMNALRINISQWIYQTNPSHYMQQLDQVVTEANQAGLYVIIDFHDDKQSGSPYGDMMLHKISLSWWQMLAGHFKDNPMVLFDPINEPKYPDWQMWAHGDGKDIVGFLDIIAAIRSTGAQQIIVVEPGKAGGTNSQDAGWANFDPSIMTDQNILYSKHEYAKIIRGNPTLWDQSWGSILYHHPIYYGEWAVLPNPTTKNLGQCTGLTSGNADTITQSFLSYLSSRGASWTAWDFRPYHLVQDMTSFTPTSFSSSTSWSCGDQQAKYAGMGSDVKSFLTGKAVIQVPISPNISIKKHKKQKILK